MDRENQTTFRKTLIRTESHNADLDKTFMHMFTFLILLIRVRTKKSQFERKKLELDRENPTTFRKTLIRTESHNADLDKTFVDMFTILILLIHVRTEKPQYE